jgi:hypothetical protein
MYIRSCGVGSRPVAIREHGKYKLYIYIKAYMPSGWYILFVGDCNTLPLKVSRKGYLLIIPKTDISYAILL